MPSPRFRHQSDPDLKKWSGKVSRNNDEIMPKMTQEWTHKCARSRTIVTQILKKTSHEHMHVKMTKQVDTQAL